MTTNHCSIASLLQEARSTLQNKTDSPRLDAELLLAHCLQKNRTYLFSWPEKTLDHKTITSFRALIEQRALEVPLAYLTGSKEFWSLDFAVTPDTLIPRPDTELLVQLAVDSLTTTAGPVLDLGTGSGIIAICIAHELPGISVDAADSSDAALNVAQQNAARHGTRVNFVRSDWFKQIHRNNYQLIISNPPYIDFSDSHLQRGGLQYEPEAALSAAENGMADINHIIRNARAHCRRNGWVMIEHGFAQGKATRDAMCRNGFSSIRTEQDIENRDRVTVGQVH